VIDAVAPGTLLITETNVPHEENMSYFGNGYDEAHLVYQFALPPLLLSAFHLADAGLLREWAATLETPSDQTTFFNFLGSHDGIGVRPVEGLLTPAEIEQLCELATAHGGGVSYRARPDGGFSPYELNAVYFDALSEVDSIEPQGLQVDRFISAHSVLLALAGIPGIYVHSLLGSRNWEVGMEKTGKLRAVNRQKLDRSQLEAELADPKSVRHQVFTRLLDRIRVRISEPAFHPNGPQTIVEGPATLFTIERAAPDGSSRVLCVHNLSGWSQTLTAGREQGVTVSGVLDDLCAPGRTVEVGADGVVSVEVNPYGVRWLRQREDAPRS
jgi:sucrose phosphorylase